MIQSIKMKELLQKYEDREPEIIFNWKDPETEAEGWTVINSLRGGAAGGGTRMRKGLDMNEVLSLAKTMEIKFTVSGPAIGGAKSGINFNPNDPRKKGVLDVPMYKQVCIIPFERDFLLEYNDMEQTPLEIIESLLLNTFLMPPCFSII